VPVAEPEFSSGAADAVAPRPDLAEASPGPNPPPESPVNPDLPAFAQLCTLLGQTDTADAIRPLLSEAVRILDAAGLILWTWDAALDELRPALACGYPDSLLAQIPGVRVDADNATAAAFRLLDTCVIEGIEGATGALVIPLLTPTGCAGVLALELQHGSERSESVRALASILAAFLAQLVAAGPSESALYSEEPIVGPVGETRLIRVNVPSDGYVAVPVRSSGRTNAHRRQAAERAKARGAYMS
jgi:hypothetical protein